MSDSVDAVRIFSRWACCSCILLSPFLLHLYFSLCFSLQWGPSFHCLFILLIHPLQSSPLFSPATSWHDFDNSHLASVMSVSSTLFLCCKLRFGPLEGGLGDNFLSFYAVLFAISNPSTSVTLSNAPGPHN